MSQLIERLAELHSRCVALAHEHAFNPYRTADAEFWLLHAERLDSRINVLLDASVGIEWE